jgi:hypothetical protein
VRDWAKIESERKRGCFSFLEEERVRAIASISFYSQNCFQILLLLLLWDDGGLGFKRCWLKRCRFRCKPNDGVLL